MEGRHKDGGQDNDGKYKELEEHTVNRQEQSKLSMEEYPLDLSLVKCSSPRPCVFLNLSNDVNEQHDKSDDGTAGPKNVCDTPSFDDVNHASSSKVLIEELSPATSKDCRNCVRHQSPPSMHKEADSPSHAHL